MPSLKRRMHSVSGRHYDDRWRNASDVFRKAFIAFYYFRPLPSTHGNCRSEYRHRTNCFKVYYTPFTLIQVVCKCHQWSSKFAASRHTVNMILYFTDKYISIWYLILTPPVFKPKFLFASWSFATLKRLLSRTFYDSFKSIFVFIKIKVYISC